MYVTRFVKGGPAVPIMVKIVADENDPDEWKMQATINGKPLGYEYSKKDIEAEAMIWLLGGRPKDERTPAERLIMSILLANPVKQAEYDRLVELKRSAPPWHPCHRPYEAIDMSRLPALGKRMR